MTQPCDYPKVSDLTAAPDRGTKPSFVRAEGLVRSLYGSQHVAVEENLGLASLDTNDASSVSELYR